MTQGTPETTGRQPRGSLRDSQRQLTRARVIQAAIEVFDANGFASTTMDDIAQNAVMNRGTIYLHFKNKGEILVAALAGLPSLSEIYEDWESAPDREGLLAAFGRTLQWWKQHLQPIWVHVRNAAVVDQDIAAWFANYMSRQVTKVTEMLHQRGVGEAQAQARAFILVFAWSEFVARMDDGRDLNEDAVVEAFAQIYDVLRTASD